ncbi:uncharacterized protein JCM6883_003793 [Sporobolomyces salmoneus]|uniref:uncharacterized protein n=1 Tax=Sporobolomyces salmoneus TaxID=183962 RepID=UPI003177724D
MPQLSNLSLSTILCSTLAVATPDIAASLTATASAMIGSSPILGMQSGFSQFEGLLAPASFNKVNTRLLNLPTRSSTPLTVPVQKAFAAAQLSSDNSNKALLADAQACVTSILALGSIPDGSFCDKNTLSDYKTSYNTILEQFVGIVPPSTMTEIQNQWNTYFASLGLIPPANDLNTHFQNVIASITASNSGELVTGTQRLQDCIEAFSSASADAGALQKNYQCFVGKDSASTSMQTLFAGILQQVGGYLPPNVVQDIINIYMYYLTAAGLTPGLTLMEPLNNAIMSMTASVSGNSVTAIQQMQQCFNDVIMTPTEDARSSYECIVAADGPIRTLQILINGIIQQSFGYLPPTLVLALENDLRPYLKTDSPSAGLVSQTMKQTFDASAAGPEFTTCFLALEDCVNEAVLSGVSTTCELENKCKALAET